MKHAALTLEDVLTDPNFFALTTATPLQRAVCRIADGLPLEDLAEHPDVVAAVGGADAVAALPLGVRPTEFDVYSGIRTAKTLLAAACAFRATQSVDVSHLRPGEVARVSLLSLRTDLARVAYGHLVGSVQASTVMRRLLVEEPKEADGEILFRHPSGRAIEVKVVAGARAGSSLVARWSAGAIFDEKPRMLASADDAVVNYEDAAASLEGRLLPGAQIIGIGSPWAPWGPAWEDVDRCWGKPTRHKVVMKAPAPALNPFWWTAQRCADLKEKNPRAYKTDVLAEFADASAGAFDADLVAATKKTTNNLLANGQPEIVIDASGGRADSFVWAVAQWVTEAAPPEEEFIWDDLLDRDGKVVREKYVLRRNAVGELVRNPNFLAPRPFLFVSQIGAMTGRFGEVVTSDQIVGAIAHLAHQVGATTVHGDQFGAFAMTSSFAQHKLGYLTHNWTNTSKVEGVGRLRQLLRDGDIGIESTAFGDRMRRELVTFEEKILPSGAIGYAGRRGGKDDFAAVVLTACLADLEGGLRGSLLQRRRGVGSAGDGDFNNA